MNRSKQLINIIEGFKLGSLGVGSKKPVVMASEPEKPKSPFEGFDTPSAALVGADGTRRKHVVIGSMDWLESDQSKVPDFISGVKWKESNGNKFLMVCVSRKQVSDESYFIQILGGVSFRPPSKLSRNPSSTQDFRLMYPFTASTKDDAIRMLSRMAEDIKSEGSLGYALAMGKLGNGWQAVGRDWLNYIWNTAHITKSPYFSPD